MSKKAMKLALEALEKCDSALSEELAAWDIDPPLHHVLEASNACGPAITALREALADQPAHQHIEHCLWARNGNQPCPHVQPTQQQEPVYWQWRRKDQPWSLEYTFNSEVQITTKDSERRALYTSPPAQRKPLTDELNQIEKDLSFHGLTLVKTATGYAVLKLGQITAHSKGDA